MWVRIRKTSNTCKEEMKDWCWLNVGGMNIDWDYVVRTQTSAHHITYVFAFAKEEDATAFKLRFGNVHEIF